MFPAFGGGEGAVPCTPQRTGLKCVLFYQGMEESSDAAVTECFQSLGEGRVSVLCTSQRTGLKCVLFYQGMEESYDAAVTECFQSLGEGRVSVLCTSQRTYLECVLFYRGVEESYDTAVTKYFQPLGEERVVACPVPQRGLILGLYCFSREWRNRMTLQLQNISSLTIRLWINCSDLASTRTEYRTMPSPAVSDAEFTAVMSKKKTTLSTSRRI